MIDISTSGVNVLISETDKFPYIRTKDGVKYGFDTGVLTVYGDNNFIVTGIMDDFTFNGVAANDETEALAMLAELFPYTYGEGGGGAGQSGYSGYSGYSGISGTNAVAVLSEVLVIQDTTDISIPLSYAGKTIVAMDDNSASVQFIIRLDSTTDFPIGSIINFVQGSAITFGVSGVTGVTLQGVDNPDNFFQSSLPFQRYIIQKIAANTWVYSFINPI